MPNLTTQINFLWPDPVSGVNVRVQETQESRSVGSSSASIVLAVTGTVVESRVRQAVEAMIAATMDDSTTPRNLLSFDGKPLSDIACRPLWVDSSWEDANEDPDAGVGTERAKGYQEGRWNVTLMYSRTVFTAAHLVDPTLEVMQKAMEFDITGETARIKLAIATEAFDENGTGAYDFGGLMGVSINHANVEVSGGDTMVAREMLTVPKTYMATFTNNSWRRSVRALVGKTNSAAQTVTIDGRAYQYEIGEMQFLGASGKIVAGSDRSDWVLKFRTGEIVTSRIVQIGPPPGTAVEIGPILPFEQVDVVTSKAPNVAGDGWDAYIKYVLIHRTAFIGDYTPLILE